MERKVLFRPDFKVTQKLIGNDGRSGIAVDETNKQICLLENDGTQVTLRMFPFSEIFSCEIFSDGDTITKTSRTSQAGGAIVGGVLLGGVGAIIGGLSGSKKSIDTIKQIDLRIIVNDTKNPMHDINLLNIESKKDTQIYKQAMEQARHWHSIISVLIKRADEENIYHEPKELQKKSSEFISVADEISKLLALKEKGILTDEEFMKQKEKLLS
jgi:hypothetical protein